MIYRFAITTAITYSATNKLKTILPLARGVIHQIEIFFPPGPTGLLHIHLNRGLHQVWPSNSEEAFAADNNIIAFREHFEIIDRPFQLEAYTWNDDDTHGHLAIIRVGVLARKFILRRLF